MALDQKDLELIERIIYKNSDDMAVSIARSFERLEERIDALESRLSGRITDAEDRIESARQEIADELDEVQEALTE